MVCLRSQFFDLPTLFSVRGKTYNESCPGQNLYALNVRFSVAPGSSQQSMYIGQAATGDIHKFPNQRRETIIEQLAACLIENQYILFNVSRSSAYIYQSREVYLWFVWRSTTYISL